MYLQQTDQFCFNEAYNGKILYDGMRIQDKYVVSEEQFGVFKFSLVYTIEKFIYPALLCNKEQELCQEVFNYNGFDEIRMLDGKVYTFRKKKRYSCSNFYAFILDFFESAHIPYYNGSPPIVSDSENVYTLVYSSSNGSHYIWAIIEPKLSTKLFEEGYMVTNIVYNWLSLFSNGDIDSFECFKKICYDIKTNIDERCHLNPKKIEKIVNLYEKEEKELAINTLLILLTRLTAKYKELWKVRF